MSIDVAERVAALNRPSMRALERYRDDLVATGRSVPHFDPFDGGDRARCLILLETPGPSDAPVRFVSRDNPTGTARNITRFSEAAGLPRSDTLLWNAVPWVIHSPGARNRPPRRAEWQEGVALLPGLLALLLDLRAVVLAGRIAQQAEPLLRASGRGLTLIATAHPSPIYVNTSPTIAPKIISAFSRAKSILT